MEFHECAQFSQESGTYAHTQKSGVAVYPLILDCIDAVGKNQQCAVALTKKVCLLYIVIQME